ncbi:peptide chain release factor N(5)-glutamine methyltransferase [Eggerthellaceae bacterium zg-1084]|uniref:N5-glutamine methyltransferase family protein n=1 Tax=Berryella wangjianweii TaxID=2734634 RepID=UPI0015577881|nr:HemK/PrmC family methyltransferase [Berryella wangjianweii]NPD31187.1 peptide chain release factor N(5)-glutamine methyltransferase [Berryella wangjianweii]
MADQPQEWTVRVIAAWTEEYLAGKGDPSPRVSARALVCHVCGLSHVDLVLNPHRLLTDDERARMRALVSRRGAGEPLQYVLGEAPFRHLAVKVRAGVLIPRPETEVLVSEALALLPARPRVSYAEDDLVAALADEADRVEGDPDAEGLSAAARELLSDARAARRAADREPDALLVADVCTGSGCIACSIATEHPLTRVFATDLSPEACALAAENVAELGIADRVRVYRCSLGEAVNPAYRGRLSLVVSNPPYIPTAELAALPREVSAYEPALALDGGPDGLALFRPLATWAWDYLACGGGLAVELHETCLDAAAAFLRDRGFAEVRVVSDLAGRPRVVTARKPQGAGLPADSSESAAEQAAPQAASQVVAPGAVQAAAPASRLRASAPAQAAPAMASVEPG